MLLYAVMIVAVPLQSWGNSFNFSIWYVEIHGVNNSEIVDPIIQQYQQVISPHTVDHNKLCFSKKRVEDVVTLKLINGFHFIFLFILQFSCYAKEKP